ncbi:hypothetical protein ACVIU7_008439 [Bradyrhizobium liaoningense]
MSASGSKREELNVSKFGQKDLSALRARQTPWRFADVAGLPGEQAIRNAVSCSEPNRRANSSRGTRREVRGCRYGIAEGARLVPRSAMMSSCACFARRSNSFVKSGKRAAVFQKIVLDPQAQARGRSSRISLCSKPLILLPPATVHGVVFDVFCFGGAKAPRRTGPGPAPVRYFITRTPLVVNRCVFPPGRKGRFVPAALPVPGGWCAGTS